MVEVVVILAVCALMKNPFISFFLAVEVVSNGCVWTVPKPGMVPFALVKFVLNRSLIVLIVALLRNMPF